jgi:Cyclopropane fatty acid synthase and related methyltransferases
MIEMFKKMALKLLLKTWKKGGFSAVFWDGEQEDYGNEPPAFKVIFHKEPPMKFNSNGAVMTLGEVYMDGLIDFEGSMDDIKRVVALNTQLQASSNYENFVASKNSKTQQQNIHYHYDLGNDFFSLWLDETMSYSCAYFVAPADSLYQAQLQKIDHILKKLNLKPGERLLDIGSGWMGKYIFPDGYVPSLRETVWLLPQYDFHLIHAESLRMHYAMTLDRWYANFSQHVDTIQQKFDERFVRMWGLYLSGCAAAFRTSGLDIYQLLFSKGLNNGLPLTYSHLYT